jgi:hypothetical protein
MLYDKPPSYLAIRKPFIEDEKDFNENLIEKKLIIPHEEQMLSIKNFSIKAQANPLQPITFDSIIKKEYLVLS